MENTIVVAMKAIIIFNQKALILQRSVQDVTDPGTWEFVGGKLEFGEDLTDGLRREVKEEAGLNVNVERLIYAATFKSGAKRQTVILTYLCSAENDEVYLSDEHSNYLWAGRQQLLGLLPEKILNDLDKNNVLENLSIL